MGWDGMGWDGVLWAIMGCTYVRVSSHRAGHGSEQAGRLAPMRGLGICSYSTPHPDRDGWMDGWMEEKMVIPSAGGSVP